VREHYNEFEKRGVAIIIISPHKGEYLEKFSNTFDSYPFEFYGDPSRKLYKQMGHETMPKWKLLGKTALGFLTRQVKGILPKNKQEKAVVLEAMRTSDVYIQGGAWLYAQQKDVKWHHIDQAPNDHATIETLIEQADKNL
jgi:hypothetical protein